MGKLILVACTNVGRYIIEEILNNKNIKTELLGVVNLNACQGINKANYDSYADLAYKYNLEIKYCNNVNDENIINWLKSKNPDIILQSGWSQKFSNELLSIPRYGCIGEHPAPLPKGRGAACVNWAILTGERKWGDTFFQMVEEYDKGSIYAQKFFNIEKYDNVFTVYEKVAKSASKTVSEKVDSWTNGIFNRINQKDEKATYYKRRKPTDGEIQNFDSTAQELNDFIRAQTVPYPCAYITLNGKKVRFLESAVTRIKKRYEAGKIIKYRHKRGSILISCANNTCLELIRVQEEGKPSEWAIEWAKNNYLKLDSYLIMK